MPKAWRLLITCEHGGYKIPRLYQSYLNEEHKALLPTHRGWDGGALVLAKQMSKSLNAPLYFTEVSRLLIDCNRSLNHKSCLGPAYREVDEATRQAIIQDYYSPYRQSIVEAIEKALAAGDNVLHMAFHSFTPELNGELRNAEFGLLYDPQRKAEREWADRIMQQLKTQAFPWRARRNYPYLGKSDGFTRFLRQSFPATRYAGFELEFNQSISMNESLVPELTRQIEILFQSLPLKKNSF